MTGSLTIRDVPTVAGILPFTPTRDLAELQAAPLGRCLVGATHVMWCAAPDLCGAIQWGALDDASVALSTLCRPGFTLLLDWRGIQRIDSRALFAIADRATACAAHVVLLVPPGIAALLLAGVASSFAPVAPVVAGDVGAAVTALGHSLAAGAVAAAESLALAARGPEELARIRAELRHDPAGTTLEACAHSLGCAPRTMQRLLRRFDTTFAQELRHARIVAAVELLGYTEVKIEAIAARTGFGTASRLSETLRRELHATAGELRAQLRREIPTSTRCHAA